VPPALAPAPVPLVLVFHGGGGNGPGTERLTRFTPLADREGFLVAFPEGLGKNWNDGREFTTSRAHRDHVDDVAFVAALIDAVGRLHAVDARRVYATGISNGGIFSHYLAAHLSARIAAIAPVVGGIADPPDAWLHPEQPVSVLMLQGTSDPLVPYHGGPVAFGRGRIIDTEEAARRWAALNSGHEPVQDALPPRRRPGPLRWAPDGLPGRARRERGDAGAPRRGRAYLAGRRPVPAADAGRPGVPRLRRDRADLGVLPGPPQAGRAVTGRG
jgi:poly(3-hydroxybutyrate) depolymerase